VGADGGGVSKMFFFEKKNQKTFTGLAPSFRRDPRKRMKSLFASFSSEKEVLPSL
jgi:hypothetical protein